MGPSGCGVTPSSTARMTGPGDARPGSYNTYIPGSYPFHRKPADRRRRAGVSGRDTGRCSPGGRRSRSTRSPALLRKAALNQLRQVPFKTSLWAAGFVSSTDSPTLGSRLGVDTQHARVPDSGLDQRRKPVDGIGRRRVRLPRLQLDCFPSIERDRLLAMAEAIMLDPSGDPTDIATSGDPYVAWPGSALMPRRRTRRHPVQRIYRMYAYASLNHDRPSSSRCTRP